MVLILNLDDVRLIDALVSRGQKRFLLVGGSVNLTTVSVFLIQEDIFTNMTTKSHS